MKSDNYENCQRLINLIASKKTAEISQNSTANYLGCSSNTIKNLLNSLEKTHLIFHCEAYKSSGKSRRYYFLTSSLKHIINKDLENQICDMKAYKERLMENFVASILKNHSFNLYYNTGILIEKGENNVIPIEVGNGKRNKKQILTSMKKYKSDYGIIISNKHPFIKKKRNIIYIPPRTFSLM